MGAELGAAKAENERLRGLLQQVVDCQAEHYGDGCGLHLSMITLAGRIKDALSQQPEPVRSPRTEDTASMDSDSAQEQFTAVDMATAVAQGFRDGQAAVEQATEQDDQYPPCDYCGVIPDHHPWHGMAAGCSTARTARISMRATTAVICCQPAPLRPSSSRWRGRVNATLPRREKSLHACSHTGGQGMTCHSMPPPSRRPSSSRSK